MNLRTKRELTIGTVVIAISLVLFFLWFQYRNEYTDKDKVLKELLSEWQVILPVPHSVKHYRKRTFIRESFAEELFRVELTIKDANALLTKPVLADLRPSEGAGKTLRPGSKDRTEWFYEIERSELGNTRGLGLDWWETETGVTWYACSLVSKPDPQVITFHLAIGTNQARLYINSHSIRGQKKEG